MRLAATVESGRVTSYCIELPAKDVQILQCTCSLRHADSIWQNAYLLAPHLHPKLSNLIALRLPQFGVYTSLGHMMEGHRVQTRLWGAEKSFVWCKRGPEGSDNK
jgi:hypothetical protein